MIDIAMGDDGKAYLIHDEPMTARIVELHVDVSDGAASMVFDDGSRRKFEFRIPRAIVEDMPTAVLLLVVPLTRQMTSRSYCANLVLSPRKAEAA
jgi:hypothetical protein